MPISSKKIIKHISRINGSFNRNDLLNQLVEPKIEKDRKKKSKKKTPYKPNKDIAKIDETLAVLLKSGLLQKNRKKFTVVNRFAVTGKISVNTSGNGILETNDGNLVFIKKENINQAHNNDQVTAFIIEYKKGDFFGEVSKVARRDRDVFIGKISRKTRGQVFFSLIDVQGDIEVCADTGIEAINKRQEQSDEEQLFMVKLNNKTISGRQGCVVEKKFSQLDEEYDFTRIVLKHSLPGSHGVYKELADIEENLPAEEFKNRKDYRKYFTVTIDGADAKDFDDAISIRKQGKNFKLYVHIADVSAYVKKGGELDHEAIKRGTSCYLGNRVIPMLPEELSNNLCSLKHGVDRLTLSAEMTFDPQGNIIKEYFTRGIIKVDKRLTYRSAHETIEKKNRNMLGNKLGKNLALMYELALILNKKRSGEGRLDLNLPDSELIYEENTIKDIRFSERLKSHMVIEECMLSANMVVSRALKNKKIPTLYRIHEKIPPESVDSLSTFLRLLNIKLKKSKDMGGMIQDILKKIAGHEYEQVVNLVVLKSLMQAYYGIEPLGHFGLGFKDYTHFTSPIRRYPDLVVHRCLKNLIDGGEPAFSQAELVYLGEQSSTLERIAQKAERDMVKIKSCRLLKDRIGEVFPAVVSGVGKAGFFVTLTEIPIEGMVLLRALKDDYYTIREDEYTVIGRKYGRRFRLGDKIMVKLSKVNFEIMIIDFEVE
ncbi:MAG: ribonuclease R [bacterium]|nr:ribonuclease R [bacterium]